MKNKCSALFLSFAISVCVFCHGFAHAATTCAWRVSNAAAFDALSDATLLIRYAIGLRGASLIAATNATDAYAVETAIAVRETTLDVSGDGVFNAQDAVAIARSLLGFQGGAALPNACIGGGSVVAPPPMTALYGGKTTSMWLWNTGDVLANADYVAQTESLIAFCKENQITELFLFIDRDIPIARYKYLVKQLRQSIVVIAQQEYPIKAHALDGAANWIDTAGIGNDRKNAFFTWLFNYQNTAAAVEKFAGLQLDVEPYVGNAWDTNPAAPSLAAYKTFILDAKARIAAHHATAIDKLEFSVAIPFWFDVVNAGAVNLAEWIYQNVESVALMAYRNQATLPNGIVDITTNELAYGKAYGRKTYIGLETTDVEPATITFFSSNESQMRTAMNETVAAIAANNATSGAVFSFAIHDYLGWQALKRRP